LLQKPSRTSKAKEHGELLQKRLIQWKDGDIDSLVREVRFIQSSLKQSRVDVSIDVIAKRFNNFMLEGKVNDALKILSNTKSNGVLPMTNDNLSLLLQKHPTSEEKFDDLILEGPELKFGSYAYESIDGTLIRIIA